MNTWLWFWMQLFGENKEALMALPAEAKQLITLALIMGLGASIFAKAFRFLKYILLAIAIYFGLNYFGII